MRIVGLCSTYKEGALSAMAVGSCLRAGFDQVLVFDGPAGETLPDELPDSVIPAGAIVRRGEWKTDAAKRTAMVKATRGMDGPVWGVWVDGDEVLMNGEFLRDSLQYVLWRDEEQDAPTAGFPLRLVEMDGTVAVCRAKCIRVDLVESYIVSSSGIRFKSGAVLVDHAEGNLPMRLSEWWIPERMQALQEDRFVLTPPLPGEPFLLHRSPLRHPERAKVRLHEQEGRELARLGLWTPPAA